jgi:hypothetical protein
MINEFLESIRGAKDINAHYKVIAQMALDDPSKLVAIFRELPKDRMALLQRWQERGAYDRIIAVLCMTEGPSQMVAAFDVAELVEVESHLQKMAAFLASKHDRFALVSALQNRNSAQLHSLLALVIHECVIRGTDFRLYQDYKKLLAFNETTAYHALTLYRLKTELQVSLPRFDPGGGSSYGFGTKLLDATYSPLPRDQKVEFIRFTEDPEIAKALQPWESELILGVRGNTSHPAAIDGILANVKGLKTSTGARWVEISPATTFELLFGAASTGAAYTSGEYGAVGRRMAWESIHQMMTADPMPNSITDIAAAMDSFTWYEFNTDKWFINEIWDLGVMCIAKENGDFGLVAGSSTD